MTKTEICNLALGYIATPPLVSFDTDTTTQAVLCRAFYEPLKKAMLESRNWAFAKKTWKAGLLSPAPISAKWTAAYLVPGDCLRAHRADDGSGLYLIEWERVGSKIYTDDNPTDLYVEGVDANTDEDEFSYSFTFALATALAVEICIPLTENATLWGSLVKLADMKTKEAAALDGSQGTSEKDNVAGSLSQRR